MCLYREVGNCSLEEVESIGITFIQLIIGIRSYQWCWKGDYRYVRCFVSDLMAFMSILFSYGEKEDADELVLKSLFHGTVIEDSWC